MNFPKQVQTRSVVILLACMLVISSVSIYYAFSASTPTSSLTDLYIEPPLMEPSYIIGIYTSPSTCYLKNGTTGEIIITDIFYTVLQAAISYLSVSYGGTGGKILIRGGNYNLTYPIAISSGDIWIEGEGVGVTTITYGLTSGVMFTYILNNWYFFGGFRNLFFNGPSTANSYAIKVLGNVSDLTFQDCAFLNFDTAVWLQAIAGSGQAKIWNFWFDRCLFEDNLHYGIYFTLTDHGSLRMIDRIKISECHFSGNLNSVYSDTQYVFHVTFTDNTVQAERQACINITSGGRQWIVSDNQIFDCGIGANGTLAAIMVNGTGTYYPDSWLIENNVIANHFTSSPVATNNSVWLTGTVRNFAIQNNYFYVAAEGVRLSGLSLTQDPLLIIKDNVGNYNNTVTSWNMGFGADEKTASYVVYKDSSYYYMMNGTSGKIDWYSSNASQVINFALGNLTHTYEETVFLKGNFVTDSPLLVYNYTHLILDGKNTYSGSGNMIESASSATYIDNMIIEGGLWDGNNTALNIININTTTAAPYYRRGNTFKNLVLRNCLRNGLYIAAGDTASWTIYNIQTSGTIVRNGILMSGVSDFWISNCQLAADSAVSNNYYGLSLEGAAGTISNIVVDGTGVYLQALSVTFSNSFIDIPYNIDKALFLCGTQGSTFSNIKIRMQYGTHADTTAYGIFLANSSQGCLHNTFSNIVIGRTPYPYTGTDQFGYGIYDWEAGQDFNTYSNVNTNDTATCGFTLIGTHSVVANSYNKTDFIIDSNSHFGNQASCINGTAIAHGLFGTPASVTLTMFGQNFINSTCWYLPPTLYSANATHIVICFTIFNAGTITAVAAPDSRTIYWIAVYKP